MLKPEDQVTVWITRHVEYRFSDDAATVAEAMGVTVSSLSAIVNGGRDWEPEEVTLSTMAERADVMSEEWDCDEVSEGSD